MRGSRKLFRLLLLLCAYSAASAVIGVFVAEGALHPARRALTSQGESRLRSLADNNVVFEAVSIKANDGIQLRAWSLHQQNRAADAVILLHGMGDNRSGMAGYAELLLKHGYSVLLPDARAHGASGGELATYGLLERDDIRRWFEWLELNQVRHASSHLENRWERLNCCNHWKWSQAFVHSLPNRLSRLFAKSPTTEWASFSKPGPGWAARFCGLLSRPRSSIHNGSTDWKPRKYLPKTQSRNRKCTSFSFTARSTATSHHAIPEGFKLGIKASCCGRYQRQITAAQSAPPTTSSRPD